MESDKKNPWPLRILLASMACFVLGSVLVIGQMDALGDALDPQRNNVGSIDANSESQKKSMTVEERLGAIERMGLISKETSRLLRSRVQMSKKMCLNQNANWTGVQCPQMGAFNTASLARGN